MDRVDAILTFDVEDIFHGPEEDQDGIIVWLADTLTECGLTGTFLLIAEKARWIKEHGRQDVIDALRPHDVGTHTLTGAHPTSPEICAELDWSEGLARLREREDRAAGILRDVFGRDPAAISAHNLWWAPQLGRVSADMGLPLVYGFSAAPPKYSLSQYCGGLTLPFGGAHPAHLTMFDGFDDRYCDDDAFKERLARLEAHVETCVDQQHPFFILLMCHPLKVRCIDWIDEYQYPDGKNIPQDQWGKRGRPRLRTVDQMETARKNVKKLCGFIKECDALNPVSATEVAHKYWDRPGAVTRRELLEVAGATVRAGEAAALGSEIELVERIPVPERMTPAEALLAIARSLLAHRQSRSLPDQIDRRTALGPMETPPAVPGKWRIAATEIPSYCAQLVSHAKSKACLPHKVMDLGLGNLFYTLCEAYLDAHSGQERQSHRPCVMPRYPECGDRIGYCVNDIARSELVKPDLNLHRVLTYAKLQSWALRPSWTPT